MQSSVPAVIIAGTHSGCGKTTLTLALMAAFCKRGVNVQPFKCGPDFIDPTLHRLVTGRVSRNLDVRMCGREFVKQLFMRHAPVDGLSVIEGVMGLFDGGNGSAARLATLLDIPVILVVDVRSAAESVAAVVKGFETLDRNVEVAGVILNRVGSERHFAMISAAIKKNCRAEIIGTIPRDTTISLPSRHLGLHMGAEVHLNQQRLVELVETNLNLDALFDKARQASKKNVADSFDSIPSSPSSRVRLGVAWDEAFCFYYQDNLDMLTAAGAEIVLFSPLHDKKLPENLDGIYLGGGYPELHARVLSANIAMREAIKEFSRTGRVVYGECGGFMYLSDAIIDTENKQFPMVGVYPVVATMAKRLRRLGYRRVRLQLPTLLGTAGCHCYGHEFHYSEIAAMPDSIQRGYTLDDGRSEGYLINNTLAGYIHLHWEEPLKLQYILSRQCSVAVHPETITRNDRMSIPKIKKINPLEIEAESFRIIESELGSTSFSEQEFAVVRRCIHATGDFSFAENMHFHQEAVPAGLAAIRAGKNILVDVNMAAAGISRGLLHKFGGQVICRVADEQTARRAREEKKTRSEIAMEQALEDNIGIVAIGNAPTALLKTMELVATGSFAPELVIGVPVGFVNAAESKEILYGQDYPFITALGRKGGTPVAVAAVNALLRLA